MLPARRCPNSLYAVAFLIAAGLFASAGTARAGCGDHVVILKEGGAVRQATQNAPEPARLPCHGPNCSARKLPPAAPVSPPFTPPGIGHEFAVTDAAPELLDGTSSLRPVDPPAGQLVRRTSEPFHPPRTLSRV